MLHYAVKAQQLYVVEAMVSSKTKKINLNLQDRELLTPLQWSVLVPHANVDITLSLLKCNADWKVKTQDGRNVLDLAVLQPTTQLIQVLIQSIGPPLLEDFLTSALKMAISFQKKDHVLCLSKAIPDINTLVLAVLACAENDAASCADGLMVTHPEISKAVTQEWTLLLYLAKQAVKETYLELLSKHFSSSLLWEFQDSVSKKSALHVAVEAQNVVSTQWLLSHIPNPITAGKLKDVHGNTPLHMAAETNHSRLISLLIPYSESLPNFKKGWHPLHLAASLGHVQACTLLLQAYKNPNIQDDEGMTAMHVACSEGCSQLITALAKHGGDVNCKTLNGDTPLHFAANKPRVALILIQLGADVNSANAQCKTPLHIAVSLDSIQFLAILLQAPNLDPDRHDVNGNTGLHIAVLQNRPQAARFLLDRNASPFIINELGLTPAHLAVTLRAKELLPTFQMAINFVSTQKKTCLDYALEFNDLEMVELVKSLGGLTYSQLNPPSSSSVSKSSLNELEPSSNVNASQLSSLSQTHSLSSVVSEKQSKFGSVDLVSVYMKQQQGSLQDIISTTSPPTHSTVDTNLLMASQVPLPNSPTSTGKAFGSSQITHDVNTPINSNEATNEDLSSTLDLHYEEPDVQNLKIETSHSSLQYISVITEPNLFHILPNQIFEAPSNSKNQGNEIIPSSLPFQQKKEDPPPLDPLHLTKDTPATVPPPNPATLFPLKPRSNLHSSFTSNRPKLTHTTSFPMDWFQVAMPVPLPSIESVLKRPQSCFELQSMNLKKPIVTASDLQLLAHDLGVSEYLRDISSTHSMQTSESVLKVKLKTLEIEEASLLKQIAGMVDPLEKSEQVVYELPELMETKVAMPTKQVYLIHCEALCFKGGEIQNIKSVVMK
ncbi:Transient receptor putative cation channel sub A member 1 [Coelomomyces lativittatus]|nr:Transient receptor putative cation channel sub A member 1 [Coelomomyces lativittatus]